jgi:hypothetical protein
VTTIRASRDLLATLEPFRFPDDQQVEAAQVTVRSLPEWRSKYFHLATRRGRKIAKVAMARKLALHLYWMMRKEWDYEQVKRFGPHAGQPENRRGVIEALIGVGAVNLRVQRARQEVQREDAHEYTVNFPYLHG